jgi:hypothetical protein
METRRLEGSGPTAFAGTEDESGEMESLLDDILDEADQFKKHEEERRAVIRDRDDALASAGAEVRLLAMQRQSTSNDSDNDDAVATPVRNDDLYVRGEVDGSTHELDATGSLPVRASRNGRGSSSDVGMDLETSVITHMRENAVRQGQLEESRMKLFAEIEEKRISTQQQVEMARLKFQEELEMRRMEAEAQHRASSIALEKQRLELNTSQNQLLLKALEEMRGSRDVLG